MRRDIGFYRGGGWNARELQRGIDRLFDEMLSPFEFSTGSGKELTERNWGFNPPVDVEETDTHFLLSLDLPGVKKEDVKIELADNQLTVAGERKQSTESDDRKSRYHVERFYGAFQRSFTLPPNVDGSKVEASYENGVLHIAVPKAETAKPRHIEIGEGKTGFFSKLTRSTKVA